MFLLLLLRFLHVIIFSSTFGALVWHLHKGALERSSERRLALDTNVDRRDVKSGDSLYYDQKEIETVPRCTNLHQVVNSPLI